MRLLRGEFGADSVDAEFERLQREATERSAEKDLTRMRWQCQSCFLQGREDYAKPMADFGVRCPADFVKRLLVQGAWSQCGLCTRAQRAKTLAACGADANGSRQRAGAHATHPCRVCGEEKPKDEFWPVDWRSHRSRGISCKSCQPMPPPER
eukprot:743546-Karenia_brevis.AAC.1